MTNVSLRHAVRLVTGLVLLVAFGLPAFLAEPSKLPTVALGSRWILYFEQALVVLIVLLLGVTVLIRGLVHGQVPTSASREGFEWSDELASATDEIAAGLQAQIDTLNSDMQLIVDFLRAQGR